MKLIPANTDLQADASFAGLPKELQELIYARLAAMREIMGAPSPERAVRVIAGRYPAVRGWGIGTLRNLYYNFRRSLDWHVLLDYARAGLKRKAPLNDDGLPVQFCHWLGSQWSLRQRGKFRAAWVDLKSQYRKWRDSGDHTDASPYAVPGYFLCPKPRPDTCLPEGWSEGNLRRVAKKNASHAARKLINIGPKAAGNDYAYKVPTTREGIAVGQYYLFDDCWNDFRCLYRGKGSRILTLHTLELASGCNILRGHKPTVLDERQVEERLKEREMLFLVAALLSNIGFRPSGTTFICEKGTATVRKDDANFLDTITDGKIRVELGPQGGGPGVAGLFAERGGGNPRWKAPIESFFNLLHNRCDHLVEFPGQTGKNARLDKPEGLELMERTDEALYQATRFLTPERQRLIQFNMLQYEHAAPAIDARVEFCNTRRDHELQAWRECGHRVPAFRLHPHMDFLPHTMLDKLSPEQQAQLRVLLAGNPDLIGEVCLSPREVFDAGAGQLRKFTPAQTAAWMARIGGEERLVKRGLIEVGVPEVDQDKPLAFGPDGRDLRGAAIVLSEADKYNVRVNPFDPRWAWLYTAKDGFCGVARRQSAPGRRDDAETLHTHFKAKAKQLSGWVQEAKQLAAPLTAAAVAATENNLAVFAEQKAEITAPDRAMDAQARKEKTDFSVLDDGGPVTPTSAESAGVTLEEMQQL